MFDFYQLEVAVVVYSNIERLKHYTFVTMNQEQLVNTVV